MKQLYLRLLVTVGILFGSVHVEAQYSSVAQLSAGNDVNLGCNVNCFTLQSSLTDIRSTTTYLIDSSLSYSGNYGFNIPGSTAIASVDEIYSGVVSIPFNFCFYGNTYNQLTIGTNGAINFGATNAYQLNSGLFTDAIPSVEYPSATLMAALQDLDITVGGTISYIVSGAAPARKLIINYNDVAQQGCPGQTATFQVVLYETTNTIELYIKDKPICASQNGGAAISGIQKDNTTAIALPGKNNTNWGSTNYNKAYRFIPNGTSSVSSVKLKDLSGTILATVAATPSTPGQLQANFTSVCLVNNDETYVVSATYYNCDGDSIVLSDTMEAYKTVVPLPVVNSPIYYCQGGTTVPVSATGTSLLWYTTLTGGVGSATAPTPSSAVTGTFKFYVSQTVAGCESLRDSVVVTVGVAGAGFVASSNTPVCLNDTIKLQATTVPNASYVWTGPSSYLQYMQNPQINSASYAHAGTYTVTVSAPGCADFSTTTSVAINAGPFIGSVGLEHPTQCQGTNGKIKLGGLVPNAVYTVYLTKNGVPQAPQNFTTNGVGLLSITGLTAGFYNSVIVNYLGCNSNEAGPVILNAVLPPTVTSSSTDPAGCGPMANGTITIHGLLAYGDYLMNYEWYGVPQTPILLSADANGDLVIPNLEGGIYTNITATRLGCTTDPEGPISLAIPPTPVMTPTTNAPICGGETILLFGASSIPTVTWSWTGPGGYTSNQQNPTRPNATTAYSGLYYLTGTNTANFCVSQDSALEVIVKPVPLTPVATSNSPLCSGETLNLSASGSGVGVTYNWNGPNSFTSTQQFPSISNVTLLEAGNYGVFASKDGCTSVGTATVNVVVTETPHIDSTQFTDPTTCLGSNGNIRLFGLNPNTTYTIDFTKNGTPQTPQSLTSNGSGMLTIGGLTAGTYTNIIASVSSCSSNIMGPIVLTDPANPATPTANNNGPLCSGETLNLTALSATPGVTYSWTGPSSYSSGQQNPTINNIQTTNAGTYNVVASINGCNSTAATTLVTVNQTPATPVASSNSPICAGETLNLSSTLVTPGTYNWTGPNSFTSTQQNPSIVTATTAATGNYIVSVIENGCSSLPDTVAVVVNAVPAISGTSHTDPTTCGGANGTITLTGLVAAGSYTVNYDKDGAPQTTTIVANGSGEVVITGLTEGVYSNITVTINGCVSNTAATITLTDPSAPVITAGNNGPVCEGETLSLSVTTVPGGTYSWSGPSSYTSSTQNPDILNAIPANGGTYTIVAGVNNCYDTATTTATVYAQPAAPVITTNSPVCSGNTLTLNTTLVSGGSYNWWGPNTFASTTQNNSISNATTAASGTYFLAVSVNGCISDTASAAVVVNETPNIASTSSTDPTTCGGADGTITLNGLIASTTFTVDYTKDGSPQSTSITSNGSGVGVITGLTQGTYDNITVTVNGCTSNTVGPITLTDPAAPVITASNNGPICEGDTLSLSVTTVPGGTYTWSGPSSYSSGTQNPDILNTTPANSGVYTVIAGVNNCYDTATTTATVYAQPATPVITTNSPVCSGNTLTLDTDPVSGGSYNWWGPNSFASTTQNNTITNVTTAASGTYFLAVSVNGCISDTASEAVVINETPNIASTSYTDPTTCGGADGTITLNGLIASTTFTVDYTKNGTPQSTSITSNGSGVGVITGLTQGTYDNISVTVNGCTSNTVGPITLTDPGAPAVTANNNGPICEGDTLSLSVTTVPGGTYTWTGPLSYSSGTQNPDILNATPANSGTYTVIVGLNNCYDTATTTATVYAQPATPVITTNSPVCSGNTLTLDTDPVSGGSYNWWGPNSWTSTTQNNSITNVTMAAVGTYHLAVSVNGCISDTASEPVVINETPNITSTTFTDPTTCMGADGTISLLGLNNNTTYTVNYTFNGTPQGAVTLSSNGSGILTITGLSAGTYTDISVTLSGCMSNTVGPITLTDPAAPVIAASNNTPICENDTVQFTVTTIPGATYTWTGPVAFSSNQQNPTIPNATPANNGTYTVVASVNNCTDTATTDVLINPTPATPIAGSNSPVCSGDVLNLTAGTVSGATYNWWGPNSFTSTAQNPSVSNVTVADAGTYYVTATVTGCSSDTGSTVVVVNPTPHIDSATFTNPTMCGGSDGTITLHGLTAATTYTVDYDQNGSPQSQSVTTNGSGQGTITGLPAGTYDNITASLNNCISNAVGPVVLVDPNAPAPPTVANNGPLCPGDTLLLTASTVPGATYNWWGPNAFTSTDQNPVILNAQAVNAGTYYVTMTVANCTSDTASTTVIINATPATPVATSNSPVCSGDDINLFSTTVVGATYTWTGPNAFTSNDQNPVITNAQAVNAGDYILSVSINNCMSTGDTVNVVVNETPVITDTAHTDPTLCGGDDGTITLMGLVANTTYTVNYVYNGTAQSPINISSNGTGDVVMTGLAAGTYGAISVSLNGCISDTVGMFTLLNPPPIDVTASNNGPICEGDTIFLFASTVSGATYSWTGPNGYTSNDQNPFITPTTAADSGDYIVSVTVMGCTSMDTTHVSIILTPQTPVASSNSPVCEGTDLNLFSTTVAGGTYSWTGPNSYTSNDQNPVITNASMSDAGQYIVSVTGNGCLSGSDTVDVTISPTPVITDTAHTDPTTCNGTDGTITLEGLMSGSTYDVYYQLNTSNQGPASYTANGSGEVIITGLGAGVYDSIYVNLNGCISNYVGPITLVDPMAPAPPVASNNSPVCEGDTILLFASTVSGGTYSWTGPNGYTSNQQNPVIAPSTAADAGDYYVTVTVNGCTSDPDTTTVIVNTVPMPPVASSNSPICEGEDLNLVATTVVGATYNWTGPNGYTSNDQNPVITGTTVMDAGQYIVSVTASGCTSGEDTVDVVINPTPVILDTAHTDPTMCMGTDGTITLIGLANNTSYTVNYLQNGTPQSAVIVSDGSGNVVITGLPAGTYDTITVMLSPCTSLPVGPIVLVEPGAPDMPIASSNSPVCEGDTIFLFASTVPGVTYNWTGPNGYTSNDQNPVIAPATAADAGSYTVTAELNNCTSAGSSTTVVVNPTPDMPDASSNSPVCEGDTLFLFASTVTGANYTWNGPNGYTSTDQNPWIAPTTAADGGIYTVTADMGACGSDTDSVLVIINPTPAPPVAGANTPLCEGQALNLTASTVVGATYDWTGPNGYTSNDQNPTIDPTTMNDAGTYYVSVTGNGCTSGLDSIVVVIDTIPDEPIASANTPLCEGDTLYLTASTVAGATYTWNGPNGYTSNDQNPVIYNVTAADAGQYTVFAMTNGCGSGADTVDVVINPASVISGHSFTDPTTCSGTDGTITLNGFIPGDTYNITYLVNGNPVTVSIVADASGNLVITGLAAGTYTNLQAATTLGCSSTPLATVVLTDPNAPSTPVAGSNSPVCEGTAINLTAASSSTGTFSWTGPNSYTSNDQNPVIDPATPADAGIYYVFVEENGCMSAVDSVTVVVEPVATPPVAGSNSPVCEGDAIELTATSTVGATYQWWGPNGYTSTDQNPVIAPATTADAGTYYVTAILGACNSDTASTVVVVNPTPAISSTAFTDPTICNGTDGTITLSGLAPGTSYDITYEFNSTLQGPFTIVADVNGDIIITGLSAGTYTGLNTAVGLCADTVTTSIILTDPNGPLTPVVANNGPLCEGDTLQLTSSISGATYTWSGPGGFISTAQDTSILNVTSANAGTYTLTITSNGCMSAPVTTDVVINPTPAAPVASSNSPLCEGSDITLFATTVTGATYTWSGPGTYTSNDQNPVILNGQAVNSGWYYVNTSFGTCGSAMDSVEVVVNPIPNPPTVVSPVVYCEGDVSGALTAGGTSLLWYTTAQGGSGSANAPVPNTAIVGSTMYYVSQTVGGCESNRDSIEVIVEPKPAPPVVITPINYCEGEPAAALTAQGQNLLWYTTPTGGVGAATAPTPNTATSGTYVYYVSQTVGNCESDRAAITVNVLPGAQPPAIGGPVMYCQYGPALPAISTYVVGSNILWYTQQVGGVGSATPPVISTSTPNTYTYYVSQGNGSCESGRYPITVIVTAKPLQPLASGAGYCQNEPATQLTAQGQNLLWYTAQGGPGTPTAPTPQTAVPGNTTYWVTQTVNGCESDSASVVINVAPTPPPPNVPSPVDYCQFEPTVQLQPSGGTILWYNTSTGGTGSPTAPIPNTNTPGTYQWWVTENVEGCESERAMVVVNVIAKPQAPVTTPVEYCQGEPAMPLIAAGQNLVWYGSPSGGTGTTATPTPLTTIPGTTNYYVSQTVNGCESDRAPLVVTVYENVTAELSLSKDSVCRKDTATIMYSGTIAQGATYIWDFEDAEIVSGTGAGPYVIKWPTSGTKVITVIVNNGTCSDTETDSVTIVEAPDANFTLQNDACLGEIVKVQPDYSTMGQGEYHWNFSGAEVLGGSGDGYYTLKWNTPGLKPVSLTVVGEHCPSQPFRDTIKIHEQPIAKIESKIHYNICSGDTVTLSAYYNTNYKYEWGPERPFAGGRNEGPVVTARIENQLYVHVTVYDDYGCSNSDSIYVRSQPCCNIWLPTAFTPNNDGRNDVFRLVGDGHIQLATFAIRNRFGQVVFETANQYEAWDGKFGGQTCEVGTYFYYVRYKCGDKYVEKKGDVTLIR